MAGFEGIIIAVIVMGGLFLMGNKWLTSWLAHASKKQKFELLKEGHKQAFSVRLQAYERSLIFLERLDLKSLVLRLNRNGMNARLMQMEMVKSIRDEFEHNLSQQLYLSQGAWNLMVYAKEETIRMIQQAGSQVEGEASVMEFSQCLFDIGRTAPKNPVKEAIALVKSDMQARIQL